MLLRAKFSEIKKIFEGGILAEEWIHKARFRLLIYKFLFFSFLFFLVCGGEGEFLRFMILRARARARFFTNFLWGKVWSTRARALARLHTPPTWKVLPLERRNWKLIFNFKFQGKGQNVKNHFVESQKKNIESLKIWKGSERGKSN